MGTKNGKWDGKGNPPSRAAAIAWLMSGGVSRRDAERRIPEGRSMSATGAAAKRAALDEWKADRPGALGLPSVDVGDLPGVLKTALTPSGSRRKGRASAPKGEAGTVTDANGDGNISDDLAAAGGGSVDDYLGGGPGELGATEPGLPLWPFSMQGLSPEEQAGVTVENRSKLPNSANPFDRPKSGERIGARYYAKDALSPLSWSQERRADLQRLMQQLGLYGDKRVRLGSWSAADQDAFTSVLEYSNVEGTRWVETLAGWRKAGLPEGLLEQIRGDQPKRPTIQVSNPTDIRQGALDVSRQMIGRENDAFAQGVVPKFQGAEVAAQQAVIADQDAGGGGTVADAPNLGNFAKEELERTAGAEVDAYKFLGNFNALLQRVGLAG